MYLMFELDDKETQQLYSVIGRGCSPHVGDVGMEGGDQWIALQEPGHSGQTLIHQLHQESKKTAE